MTDLLFEKAGIRSNEAGFKTRSFLSITFSVLHMINTNKQTNVFKSENKQQEIQTGSYKER